MADGQAGVALPGKTFRLQGYMCANPVGFRSVLVRLMRLVALQTKVATGVHDDALLIYRESREISGACSQRLLFWQMVRQVQLYLVEAQGHACANPVEFGLYR